MESEDNYWLKEVFEGPSTRCDVWLTVLTGIKRSQVQKWFTNPGVSVENKRIKPSFSLKDGMTVVIANPPPEPIASLDFIPIEMDLDILYEDNDLIVVNKPQNLSVHPGAGTPVPTLLHGLLSHGLKGGEQHRPGIVHRLDKDTTGALVVAKSSEAHSHLAEQFANKTNKREYLALLDGIIPKPTKIDNFLARDPKNRLKFAVNMDSHGKRAITRLHPLCTYAGILTLAQIRLETGRTHQIRVHSQSIGAPIVGDQLYRQQRQWPRLFSQELQKLLEPGRQMLHAKTLGFCHPRNGKYMEFEAGVPQDFQTILDALETLKDPD